MAGEIRWAYNTVSLWLNLDGTTYPLAAFQADFELNAIPRAMAVLPVGRQFDTNAPSPIHSQLNSLNEPVPAEVWLNLSPRDASDSAAYRGLVPDGAFCLFKGYTSAAGVMTDSGRAHVTIGINHWLIRANETSVLTRSGHPASPEFFLGGATTSSDGSGFIHLGVTHAGEMINSETIRQDLWGSALFPWLKWNCERDTFAAQDPSWNVVQAGANDAALEALSRMAPGVSQYMPPLKLNADLQDALLLTELIATDLQLSYESVEQVAHLTLWDILVGKIAPDYGFAVVPRVNDALVVPYVPCYRGKSGRPFVVIAADQYWPLAANLISPRRLRAVGVCSGIADASGMTNMEDGSAIRPLGIGGIYDTGRKGMYLFVPPPRWASRLVSLSTDSQAAAGGDRQPIRTALSPNAGNASGARDRRQNSIAQSKSLLQRLAQLYYASHVLAGRTATVTGALRVDLAPGSVVRVDCAAERQLGADDQLATSLYATVIKHTIAIDAQTPTAVSMILLGHVRNEGENGSDETSVPQHPLYTEAFLGAPLVE